MTTLGRVPTTTATPAVVTGLSSRAAAAPGQSAPETTVFGPQFGHGGLQPPDDRLRVSAVAGVRLFRPLVVDQRVVCRAIAPRLAQKLDWLVRRRSNGRRPLQYQLPGARV